jgi:hypothetical protein
LTPVEWLERHYYKTFHPSNRTDQPESNEYPGMHAYRYLPEWLSSHVGGAMFSIKTDQEELYFRDLGWDLHGA